MRRSPFAMVGGLKECLFFNFSVPAEAVRSLVPEPLELVTYRGFAFWNVAASQYEKRRPWPLPRFIGLSYPCISYRLFVRYQTAAGETVRGVYPVRSDNGSRTAMVLAALFAGGEQHCARMVWRDGGSETQLSVRGTKLAGADADVRVEISPPWPQLPPASRFHDFATAYETLNVAPTNIDYDPRRRELVVRHLAGGQNRWNVQPVRVIEAQWNYLLNARYGGDAVRAEPAFYVGPVPCCWMEQERLPQPLTIMLPGSASAMPLSLNKCTGSRSSRPAAVA